MVAFAKPPCDAGVIHAAPAPAETKSAPWVLTATILGSGMVFVDGSAVNVALPALQRDLNATIAEAQWIIESYALFLAALLLAAGAAGDRYGRRRIFIFGTTIFALALIWCGLAGSALELIIARGLQGVGGASSYRTASPSSVPRSTRPSGGKRSAPGPARPPSRRRSDRCSAAG